MKKSKKVWVIIFDYSARCIVRGTKKFAKQVMIEEAKTWNSQNKNLVDSDLKKIIKDVWSVDKIDFIEEK